MKMRAVPVLILLTAVLSGCTPGEVISDLVAVNDQVSLSMKDGPSVDITDPVTSENDAGYEEETAEATETPTPTPEEVKNLAYCLSPVNVREGPGNSYQIIGALTSGEAVEKLGEEGNWIQISYQGSTGWVYSKYLSTDEGV